MLQKMEQEALTQFTPGSARVQELRTLLVAARTLRHQIELDHPNLLTLPVAGSGPQSLEIDPRVVATQVTALQAKIKVLSTQLEEIRRDATRVDQMEGAIVELRRKKELEDANYRYFSASLEQSRINETLGNGRVSNLSQIQAPSPPFSDRRPIHKLLTMILAGGLLGGIAWAFVTDLYLDRSVKRPIDLERVLRVPLLLTIPALSRRQLNAAARLRLARPADTDEATPAVAEQPHPLQPFHETLRDRLIGYFESINLTHKPKLVAITGLGPNAGVSTSATGLARSLSETGEGNVLLVDMNAGPGVAQQFAKGRPVRGLDEFLDTRDGTPLAQKLFVVAENNHGDLLSRNIPQRFSKIVPKLKASDFDYIIFDMPPISQISITPRLAGFMDMVLLVVEAEKTDRDLVQRATALLADTRAHVSVVLNKTRRHIPARLLQDSLSSS
jgi:succinoglycan biosynthesis transport protein ExoP